MIDYKWQYKWLNPNKKTSLGMWLNDIDIIKDIRLVIKNFGSMLEIMSLVISFIINKRNIDIIRLISIKFLLIIKSKILL
jgi:hypothetical protein